MKPSESDWKIFRRLVPELRERYLGRQNREVATLLTENGKTPTEQFWNAKNRMDEQEKVLFECFDGHSRSKMPLVILLMRRYGIMSEEDMGAFGPSLREWAASVVK